MRPGLRIAAATHEGAPTLTADDGEALDLLAAQGFEITAIPWSRPGVNWGAFDLVLIRSTWDYHKRLAEFRAWATAVEAGGGRLWNPASVVFWNSDKVYLKDLEAAGIPIVPTLWAAAGDEAGLYGLYSTLAGLAWPEVVVKPTVSASAFRTLRLQPADAPKNQDDFAALLGHSGLMIQPLLSEVLDDGEWSFLYFRRDGRLTFSHAVLKSPARGDFRVQAELGGSSLALAPPADLLHQVETLVATAAGIVPGDLLYARIDGVVSRGRHASEGTFLLMELELIEPFLFLAVAGAGPALAAAIEQL